MMKKIYFSLFLVFTLVISVFSQSKHSVSGSIEAGGEPLPYASVLLEGTSYGVVADADGHFLIDNIAAGNYTLLVSSVGYRRYTQNISLKTTKELEVGVISVLEDALGLDEVVVTGTMNETYYSTSPVKVEVVSARMIEKQLAPTSIIDGLKLINGVQEVVACGVCFTNAISINGLPGAYTSVLMDGAPIYGNLASVYGLNGIPTQMVEKFEIIKGPSSTLYGSEAVAGVINIITKNPIGQPLVSLDVMSSNKDEFYGNLAIAPKIGKHRTYLGLNTGILRLLQDNNNDGFNDMVNMDRWSVFGKINFSRPSKKNFSLAGKVYYEDRRNGVTDYLVDNKYRKIRGDEAIYGESIYTKRAELFGSYQLNVATPLKLDYSFSTHDQDSYYGSDHYVAEQHIGFTNLVWSPTVGDHNLLVGSTLRYQYYDDNTVATQDSLGNTVADAQFIPGVFIQDEWVLSEAFTLLPGGRFDYYSAHGPVFSPRLSAKMKTGYTTIRLNGGTGFRMVNLFTEDHAFVTGQREVQIVEALKPERSYSGNLNVNHVYTLWDGQGMIDADVFYTYFTNKIVPDYETEGLIIYQNSKGNAISKGVSLNFKHYFSFPLSLSIGATVMDVTQTEPNEEGVLITSKIEYAPEWSGVGTINYDVKKLDMSFAFTANITGPMALPEVYDYNENGELKEDSRPTTSEPFAFLNLQINKQFGKNFRLYGGIQNLTNYRQEYSPLAGFNDPKSNPGFSDNFDTAYAYSSIEGREFYLGFQWNFH